MEQAFESTNVTSESCSPAQSGHFRTIKHLHGVPPRTNACYKDGMSERRKHVNQ